jgi:nucleoside-diphosphate-sugar epimerase
MCVLITGSSGYLGRLVGRDLISKGYRVVGIDTAEDGEHQGDEQFHFYRCSITDREGLREIFWREQPGHVLHFACSFNKIRDRKKEYDVDIGGTENVLCIANETPSVKQFIFSSSAAIYGCNDRNGLWINEAVPVNPGKYRYGFNKNLIEQVLFSYLRRPDMHIASLRICTVVGPHYSKPGSVVSILVRLPFLPRSFREKKIQFLDEEDFTGLMREVIRDNDLDGIFNLAADSYSVVGEIVPEKRYLNFSIMNCKPVIWVFWNLRLLNLQPVSLKYCLYPVVLDPSRLIDRYGYQFRYSSSESFLRMLKDNLLPVNARY